MTMTTGPGKPGPFGKETMTENTMKTAYFAGGCFWCIEPMFKIYGAKEVVVGYSGGTEENPRYEDVKAQKTGHRETISVSYDPAEVSFSELLDIYLANVDPFDAGGQYIDRGFSYTLAVYYTSEEEKELTLKAIRNLEENAKQEDGEASSTTPKKAAIAVEPFRSFYPAEDYHQDYYLKNPEEFE